VSESLQRQASEPLGAGHGGTAAAAGAARGRRTGAAPGGLLTSLRSFFTTALLLLLSLQWLPQKATAISEEDLLDPEQAFALSAEMAAPDRVLVHWDIADGYYLYQHALKASTGSPGYALGAPALPPGQEHEDEFFGPVVTYRGRLSMELPLSARPSSGGELRLSLRSQGCADLGVCYPPLEQTVSLHLPPLAAVALGSGDANVDALEALLGGGGLLSGEPELLDPELAFTPSVASPDPSTLVVSWAIAEGYYLYRDKLGVELPAGNGVRIASLQSEPGKPKEDELFGRVEVYHLAARATARLQRDQPDATSLQVLVKYQGCAEIGVCYPPQQKLLPVQLAAIGEASGFAVALSSPGSAVSQPPAAVPRLSEQDRLATVIASAGPLLMVATFFGFGLLLTFTPCVLPMVPILSGIIIGQGDKVRSGRAFALSLVFVLAMAASYTVAGVLAGLFGSNLQAAFQAPWLIAAFAAIFVALALSMFGFYELQLPAAWQSRLAELSNRQRAGTYAGAGVMGLLSALIVGPCVAPPLMGALIYIGQTGDAALGGLALFALSMGMGAPLLALGASAGTLLPKVGPWMQAVKGVFGVLLLAVAIYLLERIVPAALTLLLWGMLLVVSAAYLGAFQSVPSGWPRLWKGLGLVLFTYGALMLIGAAAGGKDTLQPLRGLVLAGPERELGRLRFIPVKTEQDLQREVASAAALGQPSMLDYYADWCVSCKELEKYTFSDPQVVAALAGVRLLQADVTGNDEHDQALLRRFGLIGPPAVLFFGADGEERAAFRMVGFLDAGDFREHARAALR